MMGFSTRSWDLGDWVEYIHSEEDTHSLGKLSVPSDAV